jgi:hypothetical protein
VERPVAGVHLRREVDRVSSTIEMPPERIALEPERLQQGLARLVLSVVELLREVIERQAVRRVELGDLSEDQVERIGLALLRLDEQLRVLRDAFELTEDDVTLKLRFGGAGAGTTDER